MHYLIISFTHKNTDIDTREKLSFNNDLEKEKFLEEILTSPYINEAMLLSTCNRIEIICSVNDVSLSDTDIFISLAKKSELSIDELVGRAEIYDDEGAVHHLFTVASSLDSLVVGETQIAGQLKDAFKFAIAKEYSSQKLARVLHFSFKCAGAVRNATELGTGSVSISSTAVMSAKEIFKDEKNIIALVIGAGEMSELAIKHLLKNKFQVILISRNMKKAQLLATTFEEEIEVRPYDELENLLNSMRLMFTATSAPYPIIKKEMIEKFKYKRYWFDIALPRDIEDMEYEGVKIFSVDDLQYIVNENIERREGKAKKAYAIVGRMTSEFYEWLNTLGVEPLIKHLHTNGNEIIQHRIDIAIKKGFIKSDDRDNIEKLCNSIMTQFLNTPSKNLREISAVAESDIIVGTVQRLFNLKKDVKGLNRYKCEHSIGKHI